MIEKLITRKITTAMVFLGICLIGMISLDKLQVQLLPDIDFPKLTVITSYENAAPTEIEKLITKNIEESVNSVKGVVTIYSESLEGLSLVTAQFKWETNMDMALIETKEKVDLIKGQLPQGTEKSIVVKFDPSEEPVMIYSVVNKTGSFKNIKKRIEKDILPFIERIDGVAMVEINGGYNRQININLDSAKIFSHNLSLPGIMENINKANYNFPAGSLEKGNKEYLVRTIGEFKNLAEINNVVVGRNDKGVPIYLGDIAVVKDSYKDIKSITRFNGEEAVALLIKKEPGKNIVNTCEKVDEELNKIKTKQNNDYNITKIYDQSDYIKASINNVFNSAIIGGIISILILIFFLKELKSAAIIATSIPISIIGTFALIYFKGISINTMSLGGLALGVGMMVDSGIVVLESISNKRKKFHEGDNIRPVVEGLKEIYSAVVASTLTSIVVFFPIIFLSGLSGAIFGELALTISFALIFSLISSLTLIPMLSTITLKKHSTDNTKKFVPLFMKIVFNFSDTLMVRLTEIYRKLIIYSLKSKKIILITGIAVFFTGLALFKIIDFELMPAVDPGEFSIDIETPRGTSLKDSAGLSGRIENQLLKKNYTRYVYAKIGSDPSENIAEKTSGRRSNSILIKVILKNNGRPHIKSIISSLKKEIKLGDNINSNFIVKENVIESSISKKRMPLHIEIYGRHFNELKKIGREISARLKKIPGIHNTSTLFEKKDPELKINIDRNKIASLGVNISDVAATIRAALHGEVVTQYREKDDEVDIRVRLREEDRVRKESLYNILVTSGSGAAIPIKKFASIVEGFGSSKIIRNEQSRVNIITANIDKNNKNIFEIVNRSLSSLKLKEGYQYKIINNKKKILQTFSDMRFALVLALILIYMLLASQFQSLKNPVIVMLSIPVALVGISGSLLITGKTLNINSGIGIIMLAGIVVNNAIVLFDYIEIERLKGRSIKDSIIEAGTKRLKPILMTTLTTIFALLPIALGIGEGSELQQPMAISVIGGLIVSTLLTLIFIPTVYSIVNKEKQ